MKFLWNKKINSIGLLERPKPFFEVPSTFFSKKVGGALDFGAPSDARTMSKTTIFVRENIFQIVEISFEDFSFVFGALKSSDIGLFNGLDGWGIW